MLASANGPDSLAEVHGLLDAAISERLGRPVVALPALSFTTESGMAFLAGQFADVTLLTSELPLSFPGPEPVTRYLDSVREPILAGLGEPLDFDAALADVAVRVEHVIRAEGSFRTVNRAGVFVCRRENRLSL